AINSLNGVGGTPGSDDMTWALPCGSITRSSGCTRKGGASSTCIQYGLPVTMRIMAPLTPLDCNAQGSDSVKRAVTARSQRQIERTSLKASTQSTFASAPSKLRRSVPLFDRLSCCWRAITAEECGHAPGLAHQGSFMTLRFSRFLTAAVAA